MVAFKFAKTIQFPYTIERTMSQINNAISRLRNPELWLIISTVLVLPPLYFWFLGLLNTIGFNITISTQLLEQMPEIMGIILIFVLPVPAVFTSYISFRLIRNAFTTLLLFLSTLFVILMLLAVLF